MNPSAPKPRMKAIRFQTVVDELRHLLASRGRVIVGIDGFGGGGKSTFAGALASLGGENFVVVHMDDFCRPSHERTAERNREIGGNFDWPRLKSQVIEPLRLGIDARYQRYDWSED